MNKLQNEIIFPCDASALILSHFIRLISLGKEVHKDPSLYFAELGIVLPKEMNDWKYFDDFLDLLNIQGLIVSSKIEVKSFEDLFKNFGYPKDDKPESSRH
jgi:hypothetical protein